MKRKKESAALKPFPNSKITEVVIVRIPDPTAKTPEQHKLVDMFQLRAKTAGGSNILLAETCGEANLHQLESAKTAFLDSIGE